MQFPFLLGNQCDNTVIIITLYLLFYINQVYEHSSIIFIYLLSSHIYLFYFIDQVQTAHYPGLCNVLMNLPLLPLLIL